MTVKARIPGARRAATRHGQLAALALCALALLPMAGAAAQSAPPIERSFAGSLTALPAEPLGVAGAFYVPAYSSVSMSHGRLRGDFSVTLSIHNASETKPLVIRRIGYFDTAGKLVESYLKAPVALKPFSTIEAFVANTDVRGGTGANFVVDWAAAGEIAEPVVEALMIGSIANGHYAFITQGRPIRQVGKN
ncbi:DUF3124 domain-containing protein [Rhodopseudomonas palustris]|uniref:DUF3124 domain-containing protein n=1 Tax=Rhodopseudomonas palustris (strain BisB18) TaxID=316056 RepID=Q216A9_RHOPB